MREVPQERIVTLDALRALGAVLVLVSHVGFWTGGTREGVIGGLMARGDSGVAVFFVLSAFLLGRPLLRRVLDDENSPWSGRRYAVHRAVRILPAYYLALVAVVAVAAWIGGTSAKVITTPDLLAHLVVGQGYTGRTFQSFTQSWSLTTELTFYVLLPLGILALRPLRGSVSPVTRARRLLVLWTGLAALGLTSQAVAAAAAAGAGPLPHSWAGVLATSVVGHAAWFSVGLAGATIWLVPGSLPRPLTLWRTTAAQSPGTVALGAAIVYLVASTSLAGPRDLTLPTVGQAVVKEACYAAFAGLCLVAALGSGLSQRLARSPFGGVARWAGDISYGVFLWHVLVLQVLFHSIGLTLFDTDPWRMLLAVTVVSALLAWVSWSLLEAPLLRRLHPRHELVERSSDGSPAQS